MSSSLAFRDQIAFLTNWYDSWNRCEQTVALVSLLRRLSWVQARFFRSFTEHICDSVAANLSVDERQRLEAAERCANDASHITQLGGELVANGASSEAAGAERLGAALLNYVLLLDATNSEVKRVYFEQVSRILAVSARGEPSATLIDVCRQLLSSILIHPALTVSERQTVLLWLAQYGQSWERAAQRVAPHDDVQIDADADADAETADEPSCKTRTPNSEQDTLPNLIEKRDCEQRRALTDDMLTLRMTDGREDATDLSAVSALSDPLAMLSMCASQRPAAAMTSICSATSTFDSADSSAFWSQLGTTSSSVCASTLPDALRPDAWTLESSSTSGTGQSASGDDSGKQKEAEDCVGPRTRERDIAVWLKALRLHKYTPIFETLSFDELSSVTDEFLERKGVTRGARRKLLSHIDKLPQRGRVLRELEVEIVRSKGPCCFLKQALDTVEQTLATPIRPYRADNETDADQLPNASPQDATATDKGDAKANFTKATALLFLPSVPDDDLATLMTRVLGKIHTQLLSVNGRIDEALAARFVALTDRCCQHDAFGAPHRELLNCWRAQISEKVPLPRCKAILLQPLGLKPAVKQLKGLVTAKTQMPAAGLSSTYPQMFFPLGFQPNVNVQYGASAYYSGQANAATHAAVQHRNSLPVSVPTPDACAYLPPGNIQHLLATNSLLSQPTAVSQIHAPPNNLHSQSVWRSWAASNTSYTLGVQPFGSVQQASPAHTPSSGSAMSSQLSLNSVDVGAAPAPRRGSCDVPVGAKGACTFLSGFALDAHAHAHAHAAGNDRNNNVSQPMVLGGASPNTSESSAANVQLGVGVSGVTHKRRFERTNSAPNPAALFARLRQSAPVNAGTAFAMSATIREQPSVDQDDAPDGVAHCHGPLRLADATHFRSDAADSERELAERLDSLCMSVTEAALDG